LEAIPSGVIEIEAGGEIADSGLLVQGSDAPPTRHAPTAGVPGNGFVRPAFPTVMKRTTDIVLAGMLLVVLTPLALILALVVKLSSPGPVFFRQPRVGRNGRHFSLLKFRSMRIDAEERLRRDAALYDAYLANNFKVPGRDPRLTPVGRYLRMMSVDEIPQLLNVLGGHMSLVGPRPVVPDELVLYGDLRPAYVAVRPGITGAWQVSGRSRVGYPERAMIDYDYVAGWTLRNDFRILLKTVPAIVRAHGAC